MIALENKVNYCPKCGKPTSVFMLDKEWYQYLWCTCNTTMSITFTSTNKEFKKELPMIRKVWSFADRVYCDGKYNRDLIKASISINYFVEESDYCHIWLDGNKLIISFRGTDDWQDWKKNGSGVGTFQKAWELFKEDICSVIKENMDLEIVFTGHSRGGSIATKGAEYVADVMGIPCSCIAFAPCPQHSKKERDYYNKLPIDHTNVYLDGGILAESRLLAISGYRHVGKDVILKTPWYWEVPPASFYYRQHAHKRKSLWKRIKKRWNA